MPNLIANESKTDPNMVVKNGSACFFSIICVEDGQP